VVNQAATPGQETPTSPNEADNNHIALVSSKVEKPHKAFEFLSLAAEIRNRIYGLLIWEDDMHHRESFLLPRQVMRLNGAKDFDGQSYGLLKAVSAQKYKKHTSLYRINRQINHEATSLAREAPMVWIVVNIDVQDYSTQLVRAGFPVIFRCAIDKIATPVMVIMIRCLKTLRAERDCFAVRKEHAEELFRALHMTTGKMQMSYSIFVYPAPPGVTASLFLEARQKLLICAGALRGVRHASIMGNGQWDEELQGQASLLNVRMECAPPIFEMNQLLNLYQEMGQEHLDKNEIRAAMFVYTNGLAYASDCVKLWFKSTNALGMSPSNHSRQPAQPHDFDMRCYSLASSLALCWIKLGQANGALWCANYALSDPQKTPFSILGKAYYRRGVACAMLKHYTFAAHDLYAARDIAPQDADVLKQIELLKPHLQILFWDEEGDVLLAARRHVEAQKGTPGFGLLALAPLRT